MTDPHRFHKGEWTHIVIPLACILLLTLGVSPVMSKGANEAIQQFLADTRGSAQVRKNPATGIAKFVRLQANSLAVLPGATPEARANAFFAQHGAMFGIKNAPNELQMLGVGESPVMTHVSYQQVYQGVPVFAGVLRASFNRADRLVAVNGVFLPDLTVGSTLSWSDLEAAEVALRHVQGADTTLAPRPARVGLARVAAIRAQAKAAMRAAISA
ncbi:MAG: hypothetical protein O7G88_09575 [bacterium]|nr:hypothetical protein [bacterium]